ncbi:glycosyltransferase family 2 protein [Aerococcus urinaeequi]|uniref:glycosyltransferase family 2 protein n=1 Tax=Aerococcus viridans TaxID=1377 RepID=UPI0021551235|nr:glycosyltransferase family 2 protein [Aerococcus viridans]
MNQDALVSIITPVYNAESFIADTIDSVINQTYKNFEMILVDDCSTDDSKLVIDKYSSDSRIKYVKLSENSGAAVARNKGIELATGRYISFIDSDDVWHKDKLKKQLCFMRDNNYGFTYTNFEFMDEKGELKKSSPKLPDKLNYTGLLKNTAIACSTVCIDRELVGDFRMPLVRKGQDTATWLQILRNYPAAYLLDEPLNRYRIRTGSLSDNKIQALKRTWNTYYRLEKLPFLKAVYYFCHYVMNSILRRI